MNEQAYSEYKDKVSGIEAEISKRDYDAYMNNPDNFCEAEEDPNEPTPSQMNEELRRGGW